MGEGKQARMYEEDLPYLYLVLRWLILRFTEFKQYRVYSLESLIDLFTYFGTCQDNLARYKDKQYNLGLHHAINETRKQFRLILSKHT